MRDNSNIFSLQKINDKMDVGKKLTISDDRLEEISSESKGPYTFMVLSLLYPHLKLGQIEFHQDHIHPSSDFDRDNGWDTYSKKDTLQNLQLLEGGENESKNSTPFKEWFQKNVRSKDKYKEEHYIPDVDLDFEKFNDFCNKRKEILKDKLQKILKA